MTDEPLRAVFLDLDDTLTEYSEGFSSVLARVYDRAVAAGAPADAFDRFSRAYWNSTYGLWAAMHAGTITGREVRLRRMRHALTVVAGGDEALTLNLCDYFDELAADSPTLRPGATDLLEWLSSRCYLGLITDGYSDLQRRKLKRLGIAGWFARVQISEEAGTCKPFPATFALSLSAADVPPSRAVMVGDNPNCDVRGALGVGMRAVHLAPAGQQRTPANAVWAGDMNRVRGVLEEWLA